MVTQAPASTVSPLAPARRPPSSSSSAQLPTSPLSPSFPAPGHTTTAATMPAQPVLAHAHAHTQSQAQARSSAPLQSTLPSAETQRHVAEARAAVVASLGNMVDAELQSRASMLHENAAALDKQERDVLRATEGLRRERERLAREADGAARRLKEIGNVQNWAEVLERGFLVLEETVRLANGGASDEGSDAGSSCSCSCSECGSVAGSKDGAAMEGAAGAGEEEEDGAKRPADGADGKTVPGSKMDVDGDVDMSLATDSECGPGTWSGASRSLLEPESSTGTDTGRDKGSETASTSTAP